MPLFSNHMGRNGWVSNDPYYNNVILLLRGEYWQDDSKFRWPVTNVANGGTASISAAQYKYGGSSMLFTGRGYSEVVGSRSNANLSIGTGDYTIDFWLRVNTGGLTDGNFVVGQGDWGKTTGINRWWVNYNVQPSWKILREGNANAFPGTSTVTLNTNQWYHMAYVRSASSVKLYRDGTLLATFSGTDATSYEYTGYPLTVGNDWKGTTYDCNHYLSHVRITKFARYTTTFTPPTADQY